MTVNSRKVFHCCGGCKKKREFINSGKFRVNANRSRVYELFVENDRDLACKYGNDVDFLKRNKAELK